MSTLDFDVAGTDAATDLVVVVSEPNSQHIRTYVMSLMRDFSVYYMLQSFSQLLVI